MIVRLCQGAFSRARALWLRAHGMRIEGHCWLRAIEIPRGHEAIVLGAGVMLDRGVVLLVSGDPTSDAHAPKISLGPRVYVNRHTMLDSSASIAVGADSMIGPFCYVTDHDHAIQPGATPAAGGLIAEPVVIAERCWIGAHVSILKGVTIGAGTVIGAGSVVTKSLPAGVIAVGNPARVLREIAG